MGLPNTEACNLSVNRRLIGKDCLAQKFINRLNSVDKAMCDIVDRTKVQAYELYQYCPDADDSSSSSSSSSEGCIFDCPTVGPDSLYQITVNDLDQDAYDALELLEQETCATLRKLIDLEENNINCSSSSSSSSSSSGVSSSSSSSSSNSSSSSSSSSSSEEATACPAVVYLAAYCPEFNHAIELNQVAPPGIGYGSCAYESASSVSSSSSSSSSNSSSSSSSSSSNSSSSSSSSSSNPSSSSSSSSSSNTPSSSSSSSSSSSTTYDDIIRLVYNEITYQWILTYHGITATKLGTNQYDPSGAYVFESGVCEGESVFIV